jgi:hypothetical protein
MISRRGVGVLVLIIGAILLIYSYSTRSTYKEPGTIGEALDEIVGSDEAVRKRKEHDNMVTILLVSGIALVVVGGGMLLYRGMRR